MTNSTDTTTTTDNVCPTCGIVAGFTDGVTGVPICIRHDIAVICAPRENECVTEGRAIGRAHIAWRQRA